MTDYYKCESCGIVFDEFEMNYKAAQEDKKCLCAKCRKTLLALRGTIKIKNGIIEIPVPEGWKVKVIVKEVE